MSDAKDQEIEELKRQLKEMQDKQQKQAEEEVTFKVSEKKAVSVYGLQTRFPTTLYKDGWRKLLRHIHRLEAFINEHEEELK